MYFDNSFTIKRHSNYYNNFQEFFAVVKYYLKKYKNRSDIEITIDKNNFSIIFTGKGNLRFY